MIYVGDTTGTTWHGMAQGLREANILAGIKK